MGAFSENGNTDGVTQQYYPSSGPTFRRHLSFKLHNTGATLLTYIEIDMALECPSNFGDCAYFESQNMYYPQFSQIDEVIEDDNVVGYHMSGSPTNPWVGGQQISVGYFVQSQAQYGGNFKIILNNERSIDYDVHLVANVKGKTLGDDSSWWFASPAIFTYSIRAAA